MYTKRKESLYLHGVSEHARRKCKTLLDIPAEHTFSLQKLFRENNRLFFFLGSDRKEKCVENLKKKKKKKVDNC